MKVDGAKAIVFGGSSGIGLATVQRLIRLGASVIAVSRSPASIPGATTRQCDVLDRQAVAKLLEEEGPFDVIVNAATGGKRALGPFLSMDLDGYAASFDKLWGYANVVQLGAPHLKPTGCFVLVSGSPARKPRAGQVALASVGAAVEQFARTVAKELAPKRINVVSPGVIETPMFGADDEARSSKLAGMTIKNLIPRPGKPDEVAQAILFVIENDFVTGTTVDVDGGALTSDTG